MTCSPSRTTAPGSPPTREDSRPPVADLTARQLDRYGNQLTRCLKTLGTDAPIRAEQDHRTQPTAGA
jgi:hypothetical protein